MAVETLRDILKIVDIFFILYLFFYASFLFVSVVVGSSTLYEKRQYQALANQLSGKYYVPVSVIVPAYDEEVTVVETVRSLLHLEYPLYEVIVVDDGSKDETSKCLIDYFKMHQIYHPIRRQIACKTEEFVYETDVENVHLTLVRKENGGKADALNMGINTAKYPYFICMDADSTLQYNSLSEIVLPVLENDNVVAVGGLVRVSNGAEFQKGHVSKYDLPKNLFAAMQAVEYDRSFLASRILMDKFNGNLIISGAFGLFKKDMVVSAGGYDHDTLGEDMELVVKLHVFCRENQIPYSIKYAYDAICWSQAPEKFGDLCKQRRRWHIGLFQSMRKHRHIFLNPKYGLVSFVSYFYFLLYELLSPYIEIFGVLTIVASILLNLINFQAMILFFATYCLFGTVMSVTIFCARSQTQEIKLTPLDVLKAFLLCLFEISFLRFVMAFVRATALIGYRSKRLHWGKIERKHIQMK